MSHVSSVDCVVTNLEDLEAVATKLGLELRRGQTEWAWFGRDMGDSTLAEGFDRKQFGKGQHALRLLDHKKGDYEIGLVPRRDGQFGWELLYDAWGTHGKKLEQAAGKGLVNLKNELAAEAATRVMARRGFRVTRTVRPDGKIELTGVG
jgi:hypothetical protein